MLRKSWKWRRRIGIGGWCQMRSDKNSTMRATVFILGIVSMLLFSGCASQSQKSEEKRGVAAMGMQSGILGGSLQYGLGF
jgi:hypothetical protein